MSVLASVLLYLIQYDSKYCEPNFDGTELVLAFMVHRHGDRTPLVKTLMFSRDPEKLEELIKPYGYGQLTDTGLKRGYELGKFIRRRYNAYLSHKYNSSEIYIRSTDSNRAKMTVLSAMAAVYPPNERRWNPELNWSPTPYTTVPAKYDPNLAILNCPAYVKYVHNSVNTSSSTQLVSEFRDLFEELTNLGYDFTASPGTIFMLYDLYVSQISLGLPLEPAIKKLLPKIQEAAGRVWDIAFGDEETAALSSGVLLKDFFDAAETAMSNNLTQKIRILSAHDANVYTLLVSTRVKPRPDVVKYGALYALELRRVIRTGKYVVLPVFLSSPEENEQYLKVEGCDDTLCDFEQFKDITYKYTMNETEWRRLCNFDENVHIDTSSVD